MHYSTVQFSAVQYILMQYSAVQFGAKQCSAVLHIAVECSAVICNAVKFSAVLFGIKHVFSEAWERKINRKQFLLRNNMLAHQMQKL